MLAAAGREFKFVHPAERDEFKVHRRIIDPEDLSVTAIPKEPLNRMMMIATHCDHIAVPADFPALLETNLNAGAYRLTHVAYSLQRMKENGCALPSATEQRVRKEVTAALVAIVEDEASTPDLRYEAIAFLEDLNRRDLVSIHWLDQIAAEQLVDGSWKAVTQASGGDDHATALAIWSLLQGLHPDVADTPILRRPTAPK